MSVVSGRSSVQILRHPAPLDLLALYRLDPAYYPYLLESVVSGTAQARYNILFANPGETLTLQTQGLDHAGLDDADGCFTQALDAWWRDQSLPVDPDLAHLPFRGGWFVYLAYELAGQLEPVLNLPADPLALPIAMACRVPCALIYDHQHACTYLLAEAGQEAALARIHADLLKLTPSPSPGCIVPALEEDDPQRYINGIEQLKRYIVEGDIFQANLSRAWQTQSDQLPADADLYHALRQSNPAPFAALVNLGGQAIISSSPERLIATQGDRIETRPIAGTHPRGADQQADRVQSSALLNHPKERAEHIMLIDLERNDLGRLCTPGSVEVNELMVIESYRHVHHIVSNVRGRLREGVTPGQIIRAVFPGGTITGCPKIRCMQIIAELEGQGRGAYTGSVGYLNRDGDMDLNILIRTLVRSGQTLCFRTGGGIVADSDPVRELEETRHKATGLLRALSR